MIVSPSPQRIVYFGSGAFGVPTLAMLARGHTLVGVVTQPDKPAGRGGKLTPTPIAQWLMEYAPTVPVLKPVKCNTPEVVDQIRAWKSDAWVVIAYGQKLSQKLLADRFAVNLHASLLPRWRGAAPINAAILGGDSFTGNSVITLADRMDAGLILTQTSPPMLIDPLMTAGELHDQLSEQGPALISQVLAQHAAGTLSPRTQDEALLTIAGKLSKDDDHVDFSQQATFLRQQIHALTPWPGITCGLVPLNTPVTKDQAIVLKILRVREESTPPTDAAGNPPIPGQLINPSMGLIACGSPSHSEGSGEITYLKLLQVQPPGKRPMNYEDFARGRPLTTPMKLVSLKELE